MLKLPSAALGLASMALAMNVVGLVLSASPLAAIVHFGIMYDEFSEFHPAYGLRKLPQDHNILKRCREELKIHNKSKRTRSQGMNVSLQLHTRLKRRSPTH